VPRQKKFCRSSRAVLFLRKNTSENPSGWRKGPSHQWLIGKAFEINGEKRDVTNCHESVTERKGGMFLELTTSAMKFESSMARVLTSFKIEISASCFLFEDVDI
jgi:hypothetical protein